uniref:Uncharacterized protein n=1 Tax=Rhizophora mucronata TaxID=61149 RepID=A0A2P2MY50_RHIMU
MQFPVYTKFHFFIKSNFMLSLVFGLFIL